MDAAAQYITPIIVTCVKQMQLRELFDCFAFYLLKHLFLCNKCYSIGIFKPVKFAYFILQDVSLYAQTFQVLLQRRSCLFAKGVKKLRNLFFIFIRILIKIPDSPKSFVFNLQYFQLNPNCQFLDQTLWLLLFQRVL